MTSLALAATVVSMIAGHPTQIMCDVPQTAIVSAWTFPSSTAIHMKQSYCDGLVAPLGSEEFAASLEVGLHEAAHARGVVSEPCAEMYANVLVYWVLEEYYRVPMFTPLSWRIGAQVHAYSKRLPASYQWTWSSCDFSP